MSIPMPVTHEGTSKIIGKAKAEAPHDEWKIREPMTAPIKKEIKLKHSARTLQMKRRLRERNANPRPRNMSLIVPDMCTERSLMRRPRDEKVFSMPAAKAAHKNAKRKAALPGSL